jgi:SAM-dependent methyltransferase
MKQRLDPMSVPFIDPITQENLLFFGDSYKCEFGSCHYPVIGGIPRFCNLENYSSSFGFQWDKFDRTQFDSHSGANQSTQRFYCETGWDPDDLEKCYVLEVGSGAGRFSEVFLRTTAGVLHSVDYSVAVEANRRNNAIYGDRLRLAQASIYEMPFPDNSFDKIFCLGVLQHTPSFDASVISLISKACVGGEIVVDFYPIKGWYTKIHSKYLLRFITKRMPKELLLRIIRFFAPSMLFLFDLLCKLRLGVLTRFVPITDVRGFPKTLTPAQRLEWTIMDTFDGLSPEFDNPQRLADVVKMFSQNGCEVTFSGLVRYEGGLATVVRATKRFEQANS